MHPPHLLPQAHDYAFTIEAPFAVVAAALDSLGTLTVRESDELHVLGTPLHGGVLCARPAYRDRVQVVVAEHHDGLIAQEFADVLSALLGCRASGPAPAQESTADETRD